MKRFQSVLCASLLTLSLSSAALAGNISGAPTPNGNISGAPTQDGNISGKDGNISGIAGNISGIAGNISGLTDEAYAALLSLLGSMIP
jgi:hypothetical protein